MKITLSLQFLQIYIPFLFFRRNRKQKLNFQQVGGLITKKNLIFAYSELRSTSKQYQIQKTFIKDFLTCFSYIFVVCYYSFMVFQ